MTVDMNFYRSLNANIDPIEFEKFCLETLKAYGQKEGLKDFTIRHNQKVETFDSTYQIDVMAEYTALGCRNKVIVECKKQSRSVERAVVTDLYAKTQSIGAQKAILISTSGFQTDAVKYAEVHGIALWQICDVFIKHITASAGRDMPAWVEWEMAMERYLPKFFVKQWDCAADWPNKEIYPTTEMRRDAMKIVAQIYGVSLPTPPTNDSHFEGGAENV